MINNSVQYVKELEWVLKMLGTVIQKFTQKTRIKQISAVKHTTNLVIMEYYDIIARMITRDLTFTLQARLAEFPAVVLLGPRQVGKTTLAFAIAQKSSSIYLDLESSEDLNKLIDPLSYLRLHEDKLVILDEVQRLPNLFQILRGLIDEGRRKGLAHTRFLLLGSASLELLKQASESLAGRIAQLELSGFNLHEVGHTKQNRLWLRGGFPDSFLATNEDSSFIWREAFIKTYLERDIPMLGPRIPVETLRRFWTMLCHRHGTLLNAAELAKSLAVDGKTIARYLDLLIDLLLVRRLQPWNGNMEKRLVKSPKIYVRDTGLLHTLLQIKTNDNLFSHPIFGNSFEGFVIENIASHLPSNATLYFYRTSAGAEIDLLIEFGEKLWAIEIKCSSSPKPKKGFYSACRDLQPEKAFIVYPGETRYPMKEGIEVIGLYAFLNLLHQQH